MVEVLKTFHFIEAPVESCPVHQSCTVYLSTHLTALINPVKFSVTLCTW